MSILNVEIKAKCNQPKRIQHILESRNARFLGVDHQVDTYFNVKKGRLKLREGNIENSLIYYDRPDQAGPKQSHVTLHHPERTDSLKRVLEKAIGSKIIVDKHRAIYFIDNVKFHIDNVIGLGSFVEIEAIDQDGTTGQEQLLQQCQFYLNLFEIQAEDLIEQSYSDLLA